MISIADRNFLAPPDHQQTQRAGLVFLSGEQAASIFREGRKFFLWEKTGLSVKRMLPNVEVTDLAPGLWIWRLEHPGWRPDVDWQQVVTCVCVDAGAERWLLDPLLPPENASQVWDRFSQRPPTAVAILKADHNRATWDDRQTWSVDALARRYGCRAFGPGVFDTQPAPATELQKIEPYHDLPGGLYAFRDPRGWNETPLWLPEYKTLVFADVHTERAGALRVWMSPTHTERALPDLRAMLDLPFERVIISDGDPVHSREAFERALELPGLSIWPPIVAILAVSGISSRLAQT